MRLGAELGARLGSPEGVEVGFLVGEAVGFLEDLIILEGRLCGVGFLVGCYIGFLVGCLMACVAGCVVGVSVCFLVVKIFKARTSVVARAPHTAVVRASERDLRMVVMSTTLAL